MGFFSASSILYIKKNKIFNLRANGVKVKLCGNAVLPAIVVRNSSRCASRMRSRLTISLCGEEGKKELQGVFMWL